MSIRENILSDNVPLAIAGVTGLLSGIFFTEATSSSVISSRPTALLITAASTAAGLGVAKLFDKYGPRKTFNDAALIHVGAGLAGAVMHAGFINSIKLSNFIIDSFG